MRAFEWFVLFCFASSAFAGLALWSSSNGPLNVLPREYLAAWVSFGGWFAVSAAAISFIGVMAVATARFIVGGDYKLFLKRRILTGLNFVGAVVVFFTIIYV
jgi:hypothetical protein